MAPETSGRGKNRRHYTGMNQGPAKSTSGWDVKGILRGFLIRIAFLLAGSALLYIAVWINFNAGHEILAGLVSPESPTAIVVSVARLLAPALGLWLIYRGLR